MPRAIPPRDLFSTDRRSTETLLNALLDFLRSRSDEDLATARELAARYGGTKAGKTFWSSLADQVATAAAAAPPDAIGVDIACGEPLFDEVLRIGSLVPLQGDGGTVLFTSTGKARARRAETPGRTELGSESDFTGIASDVEFGDEGVAEVSATTVDQADEGLEAQLRRQLEERRPPAALPVSGALRKRARAASLDSLYSSDEEDAKSAAALPIELDDVSGEALRLLGQFEHSASKEMPESARRSRSFADVYCAKSSKQLVQQQVRNATAFGLPADVCEAIIKNQYVDLGKVHAHDPARNAYVPLFEGSEHYVAAPSPSSTITDAHAWCIAFDKVVAYTLRFYPHRRDELRQYRRWFSGTVGRRPDLFARYRDFDADYCLHLGEDGYGFTLDDAPRDSSALVVALSVGTSSSPSAKRARQDATSGGDSRSSAWPKDVCRKYNYGDVHDEAECLARSPLAAMSVAIAAASAIVIATQPALLAQEEEETEEDLADGLTELLLSLSGSEEHVDEDYRLPGQTAVPRLRRAVHFAPNEPPTTPAVSRTLTDPPLPPIPPSVLSDPVMAGTIAAAPHLFNVSTPFRIPALRALLAAHPNRPLVESVLQGLEHGFWPGHDGTFDLETTGPAPASLSDEDHEFISMQLAKDFEKGYLSEPFDQLLPGMLVSPMFVVRLEGRKPRAVVDQTGSGLNSGVAREVARVTYDTIRELGRLMRFRRRRGEDKDATLWRSDVSGAFCTLPVCVQWQLRQVHRSRIWDPRERRHHFVYYVDRRVVFGGRFSPRLWCTVMNLVLWGVKHTLGLEFPLAYVDDAFGLDVSKLAIPVTHPLTGKTRLYPRDQARLLLVWNHVGVPWDDEKQLDSRDSDGRLVVLGHLLDAKNLTVTLPLAAKEVFKACVDDFLSQDRPALKKWQRIAGYGNWVCTTLPLARFRLGVLYDKMRGKTGEKGGIPLNATVKKELA